MALDAQDGGPEANRLLVALSHDMRRRILRLMADKESSTPISLSKRLAEPLSNVSYHVRVLAQQGAIELVGTRPARGSVLHIYRFSIEADWAREVLGLDPERGGDEPKQ